MSCETFFSSLAVDCPNCSQDAFCNDDTNGECVCTNGNDYDPIMESCCTRERKFLLIAGIVISNVSFCYFFTVFIIWDMQ